jgi:hypothetical protein
MLGSGVAEPVRSAIYPLIAWYGEGLRMTNRFGMFARPPKKSVLLVLGERDSGGIVELATSASSARTWGARFVDARLRKLQDRLLEPEARRRWGDAYLGWFCREQAPHGVRRVRLELRAAAELDDRGRLAKPARRQVLLARRCGGGA